MEANEIYDFYTARPFKTRNADEYNLKDILDLFIDPTDGLVGPFEFTNCIVKGRMGSGKTMYLRANYAYYLYTLVPCLMHRLPIILPVYIRLSDFQNLKNPEELYYAIIIKIVEEIVAVCGHLQSADQLARLHTGASTLTGLWSTETTSLQVLDDLRKLTAEEYVETVTKGFKTHGSITASFLAAYSDYERTSVQEMKRHDKPSFQNIVDTCDKLISQFDGSLLLLVDEIGSIHKSFFKNTDDSDSYFETLMNQLRTVPYIRTKLAVYPNSSEDILKETRYGDIVELQCDLINDDIKYNAFVSKTVSLIEKYIETATGKKYNVEDVFEVSVDDQGLIEHIINASEGNMRRLVHLLDASMNEAYTRCQGKEQVKNEDIINALKHQGYEMESLFSAPDINFLESIAKVCRSRSTYRFMFPNKSALMSKYTNISEEYNIINIKKPGAGRQGTVYSFDYSYCVYKDIPTHYIRNSEKIDKSRNRKTGEPIKCIATLSDELLAQSNIIGKLNGTVVFIMPDGTGGVVESDDKKSYTFINEYVIKADKSKHIRVGTRLRFLPMLLQEKTSFATEIEILEA